MKKKEAIGDKMFIPKGFAVLKIDYYYLLVNKRGNLITIGTQLPIFWIKKVADEQAKLHNAKVMRIPQAKIKNYLSEI